MLDLTIIGHRGARAHAPENSLPGIAEAADQGARWVELDVKLTRDDVPILMHDDTLAALAGVDAKVADIDFADLARLDLLPGFQRRYPGAFSDFVARHGSTPIPIPSLDDALDLAATLDLRLNLEIKPCPGRAVETAAIALDHARRRWPNDRPPPLISSFSMAALEVARSRAADWPRGLLLDRIPKTWLIQAERIEVATINVNAARLTERATAELLAADRPVLAWTVNQPARARVLARWGVSAVFTDRPGLLIGALK